MMKWHPPGSVIVTLRDGREIDLTGLAPQAAIDRLIAAGVIPADILHTSHYLPPLRSTHGKTDDDQH